VIAILSFLGYLIFRGFFLSLNPEVNNMPLIRNASPPLSWGYDGHVGYDIDWRLTGLYGVNLHIRKV
jgi:hypothetical protein